MATVVTDTGLKIVTHRLKGDGTFTEPVYIAWGTGAGTAAVTDTTLSTEASESRVAGTSSIVTTTKTDDTYQVAGTMTASAGKTVTNVGLLTASTSGSLYFHADFTGIALNTSDSITFTLKTQFA